MPDPCTRIFELGCLVNLTVRYWRGGRLDQHAVAHAFLDHAIRTKSGLLDAARAWPGPFRRHFRRRFVLRADLDAFNRAEVRARSVLTKRSRPFPLAGTRFVLYADLPHVQRILSGLKDEFDVRLASMLESYGAWRFDVISDCANWFGHDKVAQFLPEIREAFEACSFQYLAYTIDVQVSSKALIAALTKMEHDLNGGPYGEGNTKQNSA